MFQDEELRFMCFSLLDGIVDFCEFIVYHAEGSVKRCSVNLFQTVSIITTTGFSTADYICGVYYMDSYIIVCYCGASAGSISGGLKIVRIVVLLKMLFMI